MNIIANNEVIKFKLSLIKTPVFNFSNLNKKYLYEKNYCILWSYDKIYNSFNFNSLLWNQEEYKRKNSFKYWLFLDNPYMLNSSLWVEENKDRSLDAYKKVQYDIKNYNLLVLFMLTNLKNYYKYNSYLEIHLFNIFEYDTKFIFNYKIYKDFFFKQQNLKKFDILKRYIQFELNNDQNVIKINFLNIFQKNKNNIKDVLFFSNISFFFVNQERSFNYSYLLKYLGNSDTLIVATENIFSISLFFKKGIQLFKNWYSNIKKGISSFYKYLYIKYFSVNFSNFIYNIINKKVILNSYFQNELNNDLLNIEKRYIISSNNLVEENSLKDFLEDSHIWSFFFKYYDNTLSFLYYKDFFYASVVFDEINKNYIGSLFLNYDINFFKNCSNFSQIYKTNLINEISFNKLSHLFFVNFINLDLNYNFFFSNLFFNSIKKINNSLVDIGNLKINYFKYKKDDFFLVDNILILYDTKLNLNILEKNYNNFSEVIVKILKDIVYNPSVSRTFLIEKILNIKEQGNIKYLKSYIVFLNNYYFFFNLNFVKFIIKNSWKSNDNLNIWLYSNYKMVQQRLYQNFLLEYLKVQNLDYNFELEYLRTLKFFKNKFSSDFYKYSVDMLLKLNIKNNLDDIFNFKEINTWYNSYNLLYVMLLNLSNINKILLNKNNK